jgi:hypothetical protein
MIDKVKKPFSKPKKFEDLENMPCLWHLGSNHTTRGCHIFIKQYMRKIIIEIEKTMARRNMRMIKEIKNSRKIKHRLHQNFDDYIKMIDYFKQAIKPN